jgi:hypothetical protein
MLTIAGKKYAKNDAEMTDSLFHAGGTCSGYYKVRKSGILLLDLQNKPFAFVANNHGSQWFVTAGYSDSGALIFMQGLGEYTAKQLGIEGYSYSEQRDAATKTIDAANLEQATKDRKNAARRAKHQAYTDCGMKRVRGALGGVYYE